MRSPQFHRRGFVSAASALALSGQVGAQPRRVSQDFEGAPVGGPPPGFAVALTGGGPPPRWMVLEDPSSPAGPHVLAETSRDRTDTRFPVAVVDGFEARDVAIAVRFRPVDGRVDQAAGLVVRYRDARNYYVARANALENNVRLYRVVDGRRIQFAGVDARVPRDRWQVLGLRVESDRLEVSLDGKVLFSATDRTFAEAGGVGVWTKADSLTHFDALVAEALR
ncbi:hypothetical protein JYK14_24205 [Siccirubricoccus sp. KC 17139]|uniref:DUF1080 domain-containing protein n=1 Tax=Siccirubricoccus soli TaxID=2899147 RepID=A0ABT1DBC1_9PROT|nr:hypothetical protein [Siccirubricoccus soli]MCO6419240.1 hypothetical protein [Siccirubricoccus soli]MCP2685375.1 hypothetical protein [Siccirubricoccus soli]